MFIKNLKTGLVQECHNKDVIKACKKASLEYCVADSADGFGETDDIQGVAKNTNLSKMKLDELRELAADLGIEGTDSLTKQELLTLLKDAM